MMIIFMKIYIKKKEFYDNRLSAIEKFPQEPGQLMKHQKIIANFFIDRFGFKFNNLDNKIVNILETTNFQKFKKTELKDGFVEAQAERQFFKSGTKNQWKNKLSKEQIIKIEEKFEKIMNKFNYK